MVNVLFVNSHPNFVFYLPFSRFWELSLGSALALNRGEIFSKKNHEGFSNLISLAGLGLIFVGIFAFHGNGYPGWRGLGPALGTLMVVGSGDKAWINRWLLSRKVMVWVGLISYPLYLWHWVILSFGHILNPHLGSSTILLALVVSFVLAWVTYKFIELPLRFSKQRRLTIQVLCGLMVCVFAAGLTCYESDGFPQRVPEKIRKFSLIKAADFHWEEQVRSGGCHIYDPLLIRNSDECIEKARPLIMLWGDSYAAGLYPGLRELQKQNHFGIAQLTSAACPPILDIHFTGHRSNCDDINLQILGRLKEINPDVVLMNTTWNASDYHMSHDIYFSQLRKTLALVKGELPHSRIMILGPVPMWEAPIQDCMVRYYAAHQVEMPERTRFCVRENNEKIEDEVKGLAAHMGIEFVSLLEPLCDIQGCLMRVGPDWQQLESIDGGHITAATSEYLMEKVMPQILGKPQNGK